MNQPLLTEELLAQLQGAPLQQVSQQLGIGQMQASSAVSAALPLLLGALGRNTAQPQGAEALFGALQRNHAGLDLGSVLGAVLGGASSPQANGAGILGHLEVCDRAVVTAMSLVTHSIREPGEYSSGTPLMDNRSWRKSAARFKQLDRIARRGPDGGKDNE